MDFTCWTRDVLARFAVTVKSQTTPLVPRHNNVHGINCYQGGPEPVRHVWSMRPKTKGNPLDSIPAWGSSAVYVPDHEIESWGHKPRE